MKVKNEAQKVHRALDGRVEDDLSESEFEKPHDEELEDTSTRCHVSSDSPKQPGSKKTYRYKCPICNKNYTHIANHLKFFHKLKKEDVSKIRLQEKSKKIREAKSGNKRPLRPCPVKSCKWEGYRMDYHLPQKHNIKKGSKRNCRQSWKWSSKGYPIYNTKFKLEKPCPVQQIIPVFRKSVYGITPSILHVTHETLLPVTYMEVLDFAELKQ
ncbi:hypothetical protein AWC38_SpisGene12470 [Stylophora pistillata]|uniref:Uncharacterized protein n=1 Tax=Stylophora pistillata TaxID=50429 RepID=A0A2B4RZD7_STYPI|nr:hypothetical protein AWC38_SpisGene12470 [Stylophora pistillata]